MVILRDRDAQQMQPEYTNSNQVSFKKKIRQRNLYAPDSQEPYKLSRSRLDNFIRCARCFYFDRRLGVDHPSIPGYTLNSAVDSLLKNEFDTYREQKTQHPLLAQYGIDAIPFDHELMDDWRNVRKGITTLHQASGFLVTGAVDDIWVNPAGELIVVDYKATSVKKGVTGETHLRSGYRRQLEIYQWLFRQNGFAVSNTGFLVYANGRKDRDSFDGKLEFDMTLLPYEGQTAWVSRKLLQAKACLQSDNMPQPSPYCEHCAYIEHVIEKSR